MAKKYTSYSRKDIDSLSKLMGIPPRFADAVKVVSHVLPFRTNNYVVEELIDWQAIPYDPIFQLTFPQPGMLDWHDHEMLKEHLGKDPSGKKILPVIRKIQMRMNPNPAGQMDMNVPVLNGRPCRGMQHKYDETVLFFPSQGQTCHAYCTYCFRWSQFMGNDSMRFSASNAADLTGYLNHHPEVTDVLITGGDPLVMNTNVLRRYIQPLIQMKPGNISTIRIGTKSLAYWPYRFLTDRDADDLMALFETVIDAGVHLAIMAHFSHSRELETQAVRKAIRRILSTGATIRCQAPLIRHVNDDPNVWADMWKAQVKLGAIPYYMFVARDTGPKAYFKTSLAEVYGIFTRAYSQVSGLCRTVRGPSMSATPGKVLIDGVADINGEKVFVLKFIQARDPEWVNRVFFARYDQNAVWLSDLTPAFGERSFFFEQRFEAIKNRKLQFADASSF